MVNTLSNSRYVTVLLLQLMKHHFALVNLLKHLKNETNKQEKVFIMSSCDTHSLGACAARRSLGKPCHPFASLRPPARWRVWIFPATPGTHEIYL